MSDVLEAAPAPAAPPESDRESGPGFGRRLAAERERKGLSIDDIAARLRFNPKQVQAIESEKLPALPAPFLRGFVRNYARELKLDPAPLLEELNQRLGPDARRVEQEDKSSGGSRGRFGEHVSGRLVMLAVILGLVALLLVGWLASRNEATRPGGAPQASAQLATVAAPPVDEGKRPASETATTPAGSAPVDAPAAATPVAAQASAPPGDSLHMIFRERSWVEVTQGDGQIIHSQINAAGTEQRLEGKAPLRAVIGNASEVVVEYKGAPVDLKPVTSVDNVARITLN